MTAALHDRFPLSLWPLLDDFLCRCYGRRYALRDQALMRWQFGGAEDPASLSIMWYGDEGGIVSMLGCRPTALFWGAFDQPVAGGWLSNWMSDPGQRSGAGAVLMRRAQERFPVVLAQGASAANKPIAERLGFRIFEPIDRLLAVFDPMRAARFLAPDAAVKLEPMLPAVPAGAVERGLPADYAPDWSRYPACMAFGAVRSAAHLRWRYLGHPVFRYEIDLAPGPSGPAVCIWRLERAVGEVHDTVGRIVDFFHPADGAAQGRAALSSALGRMQDAGAAFADLLCSAGPFLATARAAGMVDATTMPLAFRLSPTERRLRLQNVEFWAAPGLPRPAGLADCLVSKGDGDQDRPNHP
ncbi:hypothetical protein [Desertibaculum subflavum]|uniref:hypothetical protein n=1 Tax=Desertibaculum subflavum TaxID=2268458 RepID=UPI000E6702D9